MGDQAGSSNSPYRLLFLLNPNLNTKQNSSDIGYDNFMKQYVLKHPDWPIAKLDAKGAALWSRQSEIKKESFRRKKVKRNKKVPMKATRKRNYLKTASKRKALLSKASIRTRKQARSKVETNKRTSLKDTPKKKEVAAKKISKKK